MAPNAIMLPPAPLHSDSPHDKDFLHRWSLAGSPASPYITRRASIDPDSPREVPMPTPRPSAVLPSPGGSSSTAVGVVAPSPRRVELSPYSRDLYEYFSSRSSCRCPSPHSTLPVSASASVSASTRLDQSSPRTDDDDDDSSSSSNNTFSSSDWSAQTPPSPPPDEQQPVLSPELQGDKQLMTPSTIGNALCSDLSLNSPRSPSTPHRDHPVASLVNPMTSSFSSPPQLRTAVTTSNESHLHNPSQFPSNFTRPQSLPDVRSASNANSTLRVAIVNLTRPNSSPESLSHLPSQQTRGHVAPVRHIPFHMLPRTSAVPPTTTLDEAMATTWDDAAGVAHAERVRSTHARELGSRPPPPRSPHSTRPREASAPVPVPSCSNSSGTVLESRLASQRFLAPPNTTPSSAYPGLPPPPLHSQLQSQSQQQPQVQHLSQHQHQSQQSHHQQGPLTTAPIASLSPSYPAPEPPTISGPLVRPGPFASAPLHSWVELQTTWSDYQLKVRLPGFTADGIQISAKHTRILRVVADCWGLSGGPGHFEREIRFGYDADLPRVTAGFDDDTLRIRIPRRLPPL